MNRLILLRHGGTEYDNSGMCVAGWDDCALSENGKADALEVGRKLKELGLKFDIVFTSRLRRSVEYAWLVCGESDNCSMPIINTWRLNERHFGALQGLTVAQLQDRYGDEMLKRMQTGFNTKLPELSIDDPSHPKYDKLYSDLPADRLPSAESMAETAARTLPLWDEQISNCVKNGMTVLVVGHVQSLRTLSMQVEGLSEEELTNLPIPPGVPVLYELDKKLAFLKKSVLIEKDETSKEEGFFLLEQGVKPGEGYDYDLVVVGAGPAGVKAAEEAGSRGQRVALVDPKRSITGAPTGAHSKCLREAAMSGAKAWDEVQKVLDRSLANANHETVRALRTFHVTIIQGKAQLMDTETVKITDENGIEKTISTHAVIIATGSKANRFPPTNFDLPGVFDSDTIQTIARIPEVMVVQGAGIVSVEYATFFSKLGSKVTMIDAFPAFLPMMDECLQDSVREVLKSEGVEVLMSTPFKSVEAGEGTSDISPKIKIEFGEGPGARSIECDCLLSATGRHANSAGLGLESLEGIKLNPRGKLIEVDDNGYTGCARIYAVGDCATGSMGLATMGVAQAIRAARSLFTQSGFMKYDKKQEVKPFGVWTIPDLAWAGKSEGAARKEGIDYCVAKVKYNQTVRGCVTNEDGYLKLIFDRTDGVVIGVHIFGENSCEIINYGAEAVENKTTIFDMLHFVFPAVTYHTLYTKAAAEGKIRMKGARCLAAATAWRRVQTLVEKTLEQAADPRITVQKVLESAFHQFDDDKSGFLSPSQLQQAVKALGLPDVTEDDIKGMIEEATEDADEENVDYETFLNMLWERKPSDEEVQEEMESTRELKRISTTTRLAMSNMLRKTSISAQTSYDLVVIGGGPAGVRAAEEAASRGKRTVIIEPKAIIHGAPTGAHSKCIREAVLDGAKTWDQVENVLTSTVANANHNTVRLLKTFHIDNLKGTAKLEDESTILFTPNEGVPQKLTTSAIVIATGSKANRFPPTNFDLPGVFDTDTITTINRIPNRFVVQGSGIAGVEYAVLFAMLGSKVTIVEAFPAFLPMLDEDLRNEVKRTLDTNRVTILMNTPFKAVDAGEGSTSSSPSIKIDIGDGKILECDALLSATGRSGNTAGLGLEALESKGLTLLARGKLIQVDDNCWSGCGTIYACGDCATGSMGLATMGQDQAVRAVKHMFTKEGQESIFTAGLQVTDTTIRKDVKPSGVWTIPEVAWAGISEEAAKKKGINYGVAKIEYKNTIRGCVSNEDGFLKLIFNRDDGVILAVHLCGELACELVNYGAELVNRRKTIFEMLHFVFPAVTYHSLYLLAATEAKIRLRGVRDVSAATAWKRLANMVQRACEVRGDSIQEALRNTFQKFDYDKSGFLSQSQLHDAVEGLGIFMSEEDVEAMVLEATGDPSETEVDYETMLKMLSLR